MSASPRLVVDATPIRARNKGLGIFLRMLLDEFEKSPPWNLVTVYIDASYFEEASRLWPRLPLAKVVSSPAVRWEQVTLPRLLGRAAGVLLFTGKDRVAPSLAERTIMYLFEIPDYRIAAARNNGAGIYSRLSDAYNLWNFRRVARRIGRFVVSSASTRDDLIRAYGVAAERIALVYPAIRGAFFNPARPGEAEAAREAWTAGRPYVLHFSTGDPRDNTKTALAAFAEARRHLPEEVVLFVAGTTPEVSRLVTRQAHALGIWERVMTVPFVSEEEMVSLYRGAVLYLDPTLYEGFGMQIVEAMACGVPVVASGVTSVPEVTGNAALLCEPGNVGGISRAIVRVLSDEELAVEMRERGRKEAGRFRIRRAAGELLAILRSGGGGH